MMTKPDPERITLPSQGYWEIKDNRINANDYLMSDFLNWNRVLFSFRGDFWSNW
jgi:hypothetical protein